MLRQVNAKILAAVAVLALVAVAFVVLDREEPTKTATAYFPRAVSIYPETEVRILGVKIGRVTSVTPDGESVRVAMEYDADYQIPADAKAVIVTPTLVADRFIQLTPVYESGPTLADGAEIALPDTGVPVELDRIYSSLRDLSVALGPNGVNKDGTLNRVLEVAAEQLEGKGAKGNKMIRSLAEAAETFGSSSGDLFETVTNLASFTETLAANDELVNAFVADLAGVSSDLADERQELEAALAAVAGAVTTVKTFVADNRKGLSTNVKRLTKAVKAVASEKEQLNRALYAGPVAIGNLNAGFDVRTGSQNSRFSFAGNIARFDRFLCALITQSDKISNALTNTACTLFENLLVPLTSPVLGRSGPGGEKPTKPNRKQARPDVEEYNANTTATLADLMGGS
ncbi:MCE family protein [Nocardioides dubius]|uniref:MCE family protein n=1 Tax=Nocardioides dubius TaxID=317019 RepID=A0ABP4E550_9ACTN